MAAITGPPGEKLMNKPQVQKTEPLKTKAMRTNIMAQVAYQVVIFVIVQFKGQVFNQFNSREIEKLNVFKNIYQKSWFRVATSGLLALQVASVEISGIIKGNASRMGSDE
ncbi:calcium-transporting ATPase, plasma membrane-type [Salix suchowensis]|nr:calcium-transporting ATPase, plasma membrane-type [Salix suchowensis]